jgi:hypothetical protein
MDEEAVELAESSCLLGEPVRATVQGAREALHLQDHAWKLE